MCLPDTLISNNWIPTSSLDSHVPKKKKKIPKAYGFSILLYATHVSLSLPLFYYLWLCHHLRHPSKCYVSQDTLNAAAMITSRYLWVKTQFFFYAQCLLWIQKMLHGSCLPFMLTALLYKCMLPRSLQQNQSRLEGQVPATKHFLIFHFS